MEIAMNEKRYLGINGLGRIGKLSLWYHLLSRRYDGIVINIGREVGKSLEDVIHTLQHDTTYGLLDHFLYGRSGKQCEMKILDRATGLMEVEGLPVKILSTERSPKNIGWAANQVRTVVDCTGKFLDPTLPADHPAGSLKGHLASGAVKVIASAPFKIKDPAQQDVTGYPTLIFGVNHLNFNAHLHHVISAASCTTTALAHMLKPLLEKEETSRILTASMTTVHAATNTQSVLDAVPASRASDLRKNRSVMNNIIISSTGAGKTLEAVLPGIAGIGFMADSIRIPTNTVSLVVLNLTFHSELDRQGEPVVNAGYINKVYQEAAMGAQKNLLFFSDRQNVSSDLLGYPAAVMIEGHETHTRTGFQTLTLSNDHPGEHKTQGKQHQVPVTHAKIFGWYDNEFGSYVRCLGLLTEFIESN